MKRISRIHVTFLNTDPPPCGSTFFYFSFDTLFYITTFIYYCRFNTHNLLNQQQHRENNQHFYYIASLKRAPKNNIIKISR